MRRAVAEYRVVGIRTTLPLFARVLESPAFLAGDFDTSFLETELEATGAAHDRRIEVAVAAAAIRALEERRAVRAPSAGGGAPAWRAAGLGEAHRSRLGSQG
jgi:acetyl/propionyl-CoA carboxylase alpha subunit